MICSHEVRETRQPQNGLAAHAKESVSSIHASLAGPEVILGYLYKRVGTTTHAPMSPPNTHLALTAVVSALLIFRATKRAPKKHLPLLNDLKAIASQVDANDVTGEHLFGSEYDIVIVGGGEFAFVPFVSGSPKRLISPVGTAGCVLAARLSEEPNLRVLLIESGEKYILDLTSRSTGE